MSEKIVTVKIITDGSGIAAGAQQADQFYQQMTAGIQQVTAQGQQLNQTMQQLGPSIIGTAQDANIMAETLAKVQQQMSSVVSSTGEMATSSRAAIGALESGFKEVGTSVTGAVNGVLAFMQAEKEAADAANRLAAAAKKSSETQREQESNAQKAAIAYTGFAAAIALVTKNTIESAAAFETAQARMQTFLGGIGGAQAAGDIRQSSLGVGLDSDAINTASVKLAEFSDFSVENLKRVENAALATGRSVDGVAQLFARAEETGSAAARAMRTIGVTMDQLAKQGAEVRNGKVFADPSDIESMEKFRAALERVFDAKFGAAGSQMMEDWTVKSQLLQNQLHNLSAEFGEALLPGMKGLVDLANTIVQGLSAIPEPVKEIIGYTAIFAAGVAAMTASVAMIGPVIGAAVAGIGTLFAGALGIAGAQLLAFAAVLAGVNIALQDWYESGKKAEKGIQDQADALTKASNNWRKLREEIEKTSTAKNHFNDSTNLGDAIGGIGRNMENMTSAQGFSAMKDLGIEDIGDLREKIKGAASEYSVAIRQYNAYKDKTDEESQRMARGAKATADAALKAQTYYSQLEHAVGGVADELDRAIASSKGLDAAFNLEKQIHGVKEMSGELQKWQAELKKLQETAKDRGIDVSEKGIEAYFSPDNKANQDKTHDDFYKEYGKANQHVNTLQGKQDQQQQENARHATEEGIKLFNDGIKSKQDALKEQLNEGEVTLRQYAAKMRAIAEEVRSFGQSIAGEKGIALINEAAGLDVDASRSDKQANKEDTRAKAKAARTTFDGLMSGMNRDITAAGKHNDIGRIQEDLDKEVQLVKDAEAAKTLTREQAANKLLEIEDKRTAAVEAHRQKEEAAEEHLSQVQQKLADMFESSVAKRYAKGGPGAPTEQDVTAAIQQQKAMMDSIIEQKRLKEIQATGDVRAANAEAAAATLEEYQKLSDEIDAISQKAKQTQQDSMGMTGPMSMSQAFDYLGKSTSERWYGKGSGLSEGFNLNMPGAAAPEATGPLAELKKTFDAPIKTFSDAVGVFAKTMSDHASAQPKDYGPTPSMDFGSGPDAPQFTYRNGVLGRPGVGASIGSGDGSTPTGAPASSSGGGTTIVVQGSIMDVHGLMGALKDHLDQQSLVSAGILPTV